eukprot:CAMPEP_0178910928 /NCGR_PEP_ID=MMETSP0786-20121207/9379_1 /TAXON_ID=186022 /ORGANISM="Thalassionema frauenfeldii, Strain CCMP 1798" /LENGTH=163 /DNA_ID=CAMNT_0020583253 /DNA_START=460 /DNA_END=951 /DNA_ORIENTATION=-
MKATAKALEQFASDKSDDEETKLYHDELSDDFEYKNNHSDEDEKEVDKEFNGKTSTKENYNYDEDYDKDNGTDNEYEWEEEATVHPQEKTKKGWQAKERNTIDGFLGREIRTPKEKTQHEEGINKYKAITPENGEQPNKRQKDTKYCTPERLQQKKHPTEYNN